MSRSNNLVLTKRSYHEELIFVIEKICQMSRSNNLVLTKRSYHKELIFVIDNV